MSLLSASQSDPGAFEADSPATRVRTLHRQVPGRIRLHVPGLYAAAPVKQRLETTLGTAEHVRAVRANTETGNLLITFDPSLDVDALVADIIALLYPAPAPPVPGSEAAPGTEAAAVTHLDEWRRRRAASREAWHTRSGEETLRKLGVDAHTGLSAAQVALRRAQVGRNVLTEVPRRSDLAILRGQIASVPVALLGASAVVSVLTGGFVDAVVILGVVAINAAIGFVTERRAEDTIASLSRRTPLEARITREAHTTTCPARELVPGDLVEIGPGDYVPADLRLLQSRHLSVDESPLTGESLPVSKDAAFIARQETPLADRRNLLYMGTLVVGGSARGVVVATGNHTELGNIQALVGEARAPETPMQRQLDSLATRLVLLSGAACVGVFFIGLLRGRGLLAMLNTTVSLVVAAVPEGLPAVATTTLALGARDMRQHGMAVRHLGAVETMGAVQVLCLDKTGTLTQNRMEVAALHTGGQRLTVEQGRMRVDGTDIPPESSAELTRLLQTIALCSETQLNGNGRTPTVDGSPTEAALVRLTQNAGIDVEALRRAHPRLRIQHRAEGRPYMRTVHAKPDGQRLLAVKGSPEAVLERCDRYMHDGAAVPLDAAARERILDENARMADEALRVLGVAFARRDNDTSTRSRGLVWLGLIGLADPLRPGMKALMSQFHAAGIRTLMLTGDQSATARAVGRALELNGGAPLRVFDAEQLDKVAPEALPALIRDTDVFARVTPSHKLQIVQGLQQAGFIVAMTGDGINDGPALKAADVGIAMGHGGSDVATSIADVVIEDDRLETLTEGIASGRSTYLNIRKALRFLLATNISEIQVMFAGAILGQEPLTPTQLLWINLITDIFPALALVLEPDEPDVMNRPPRDPAQPLLGGRELRSAGRESSVLAATTMASYGYGLLRYGAGPRAATLTFTTLTAAQLLQALSARSDRRSVFQRSRDVRPNAYLNTAVGVTLAAQALTFFPPLRNLLGVVRLAPLDLVAAGAGALLPVLINESRKPAARH